MNKPQYFSIKELLTPPLKRAAYSDRTSWIMAQCSAIAYQETKAKIAPLLKEGGFELVAAMSNPYLKSNGFLAVSKIHKLAVLSFKGTIPKEWKTVETDLDFKSYVTKKGTFHEGFLKAYQSLEPQILKAMGEIGNLPLYITGHSLGGAMAIVASMNLPDTDKVAACYTFGSPRVCDLKTVIKFYKIPIYRVVHETDIVPSLPPVFFSRGFAQAGDLRYINDQNELTPGSAAVFRRIGLQIKAIFRLAFFKMVGDHAIADYWKILQNIAEERENKVVTQKIKTLKEESPLEKKEKE